MSPIILIGFNDSRYFDSGWYGVEKSPEGILYRASAARGILSIPLSGKIQISMLLSARPQHVGQPLSVTLHNEAESFFQFELKTNHWVLRQGEIVLTAKQPLVVEVQNPWSPDALYHNGDIRSIGILLSAMRIIRWEKE